jgi:hypothetical protein
MANSTPSAACRAVIGQGKAGMAASRRDSRAPATTRLRYRSLVGQGGGVGAERTEGRYRLQAGRWPTDQKTQAARSPPTRELDVIATQKQQAQAACSRPSPNATWLS